MLCWQQGLFLLQLLLLGDIIVALSCPVYPAVPLAGVVTTTKYTSSIVFRYTCIDGYHLLGPSERVCSQPPTAEQQQDWNLPQCAWDATRSLRVSLEASKGLQGDIEHAIDVNEDNEHLGYKCTEIQNEDKNHHLTLAFSESIPIVAVNLTLAQDEAFPESLEVRIGSNPDPRSNPLCEWVTKRKLERAGGSLILTCGDQVTQGDHVSILAVASGVALVICDVKVLVTSPEVLNRELCSHQGEEVKDKHIWTHNGQCVMQDMEKKSNFKSALSTCAKLGLRLLTTEDPGVFQAISEAVKQVRVQRRWYLWLGAKLNPKDGKWHWHNGSHPTGEVALKDQNWGPAEPGGEDCVVLDSRLRWGWNSVRCIISAFGICHGRPQRCPKPDSHEHTFIKEPRVYYSVGDSVVYACGEEGYAPTHSKIRYCQANGAWTGIAPACTKMTTTTSSTTTSSSSTTTTVTTASSTKTTTTTTTPATTKSTSVISKASTSSVTSPKSSVSTTTAARASPIATTLTTNATESTNTKELNINIVTLPTTGITPPDDAINEIKQESRKEYGIRLHY